VGESYFVARDEKQIGPFTDDELLRAIREGRYEADDLLWQDSVGDWQPLGEVSPFKHQFGSDEVVDPKRWAEPPPPPLPPLPQAEIPPVQAPPAHGGELIRPGDSDSVISQRRPFVRYAARLIDMGVFIFIAIPLTRALGFGLTSESLLWADMLMLALLVPVEALVLAQFGTTPGKAFMRMSVVRDDGLRLDLQTAMSRSAKVWLLGWGLGIPIVSMVTRVLSFARLMGEGKTAWDSQCGTRVIHQPIGFGRALLAIVLIFFLMGSSLSGIVEQATRFGS